MPSPPPESAAASRPYERVLMDVTRDAAQQPALDELLRQTMRTVRRGLRVDAAILFMRGVEGNRLRPAAGEGLSPKTLQGYTVTMGRDAVGYALQENKVVLMWRAEGLRHDDDPLAVGYRGLAAIPIVRGEDSIGSLLLLLRDGSFAEDEKEHLAVLGSTLALAIDGPRARRLAAARTRDVERILTLIPSAILGFDQQGRINYASPGAARLLAIAPAAVRGKPMHEVVPSRVRSAVEGMVKQTLRFGVHCEDVLEIGTTTVVSRGETQRSGATAKWWCLMSPARGERGPTDDIIGGIVLLQPVTREIEQGGGEDVTTSFVSMLSHELRTPLTSLRGAVHLLAEAGPNETIETHRGLVTIAQKNTERLIRLIDDLIHVSQLENGALKPVLSPLDLGDLAESAISAIHNQASARAISLVLEEADTSLGVRADRTLLLNVLRHLLDNAVKYSHDGGRVVLTGGREGSNVWLDVRDEGDGVAPDMRDSLFERFKQGDTVLTRRQGGNGLGLYIAREVMALHKGSIELRDSGPGGSTFRLTLPGGG